MPEPKEYRPRGRPLKGSRKANPKGKPSAKIDVKMLRELCKLPLTQLSIARALGVCKRSLTRFLRLYPEYRTEYKKGRELWQKDILALQMRAARRLNPQILIHLGKNYCGQSDRNTIDMHVSKIQSISLPNTIDLSALLAPGITLQLPIPNESKLIETTCQAIPDESKPLESMNPSNSDMLEPIEKTRKTSPNESKPTRNPESERDE